MAFDAILFRNAECSLKYTNDFSNRVIVPGKIVRYPFFRKFKFGFKKWFDNQLLSDFVQTEEVVYPRLVRMFFANLQMNVEGTTLTSRVNGVDITVNPSVLALIYSIPESGMQHYQTHKEVSVEGFNLDEELKRFTGREEISQDWPDASDFTIEFRLLHHMIINIFLPRSGGRSNVSNLDVYMMWAIANGKKLNFPFMMFHHMNDVLKKKKTYLPYGMALTKLFQYFEVRLDEETDRQTAKSTDFYNEGTMHRFGYTLEHNKWVPNPKTKRAIADREDEEADRSLLKKPTLRTTASTSQQIPSEIIALLQEMKDDIRTLKENRSIATSQPPPPTLASSSQQIPTEIIALLQDMKNDIQTLKANQPIAASQPSPYQALINPPHTGVFPTTYKLERTKSDDELGTLQAYLQKLGAAENIPEFVSKHPFGQDSINEKEFAQCKQGDSVVLVGANGEELGIGNVFQVRGQWYGRNLEELRTYVVDVKELKAGRATRLPHPSMATGVSFEEAETKIGVMRVLWDSNMTLLYRPQ